MSSLYPQAWGRYLLLEHLASGGMADIYLAIQAKDLTLSRLVVIKRMRSAQKNSSDWQEMFKNEAQVLLCLQSPHIVQTYDVHFEEREPYLVLEYINGLSLKRIFDSLANSQKSCSLAAVLEMIKQAAQALNAAHNFRDPISGNIQPILHRDISPHNILISANGYLKMIDFGIAKSEIIASLTASGMIKGKFSYMSPEQYLGEKKLDARSDLFSVGIIMWELLSGNRLFETSSSHADLPMERFVRKNFEPQNLSALNPEIPHTVSVICSKLLSLSKEDRYESAQILENEITNLQKSLNLPSGVNVLAQFINENFSDEIRDENSRINSLVEKSKKLTPETSITRTSVERNENNNSPTIKLKPLIIITTLILISVITTLSLQKIPKIEPQSTSEVPLKSRSETSERGNRQRAPYSFLGETDQAIMRKYINLVRQIISTESEAVRNTFLEKSNHEYKVKNNMRAAYFKGLPQDQIKKTLKNIENFLKEYNSELDDKTKLELISRFQETLEIMPAPRLTNE